MRNMVAIITIISFAMISPSTTAKYHSFPDRNSMSELCINIANDNHSRLRKTLSRHGLRMNTHFNIIKCASQETDGYYVNVLKFAAAHNSTNIIPLMKMKKQTNKYLDRNNDNDGLTARVYINKLPHGSGYIKLLLN